MKFPITAGAVYPLVFMDRTVLAIGLLKSGIGPVPRLQD
eukprot:SAG11_NODE_12342_length_708_cov_0.926108_2_plen_38_part_01